MITVNSRNAADAADPRQSSSFAAGAGEAFRAAFQDAQQRGASALGGGVRGASPGAASESEQEFMDYASMSLQDKMFYAALASLGISKKDYDAMSAADKLKIAEKVSLVMQQLARAEQAKQADQARSGA
ncbi:hypothetical protein SB816_06600 [Achromobacter sp. SIMBA_011]|uniref:Uncharacterized protein n=1 Tax=Achromobacter dolens TaxID=1287738 RepID=A0A6S7DGC9_9BURK|nr:hypothetical protein [Achromobacter dolens]MBQ2648451.1 hypothetical protein [Achromobacter sp.]OAS90292.1 hypothetical protein A6I77_01175 [Achromobacter xylosoxidans]MCZ8406515.1 hypothetical protein [Achromobacter dolens]CAB3636276.1 hypothetical protein LMG26840_01643 [Achromobacter dolens]CAB3847931.1 hypothetical protein LMG26841_01810 [Achromobacter dolens]